MMNYLWRSVTPYSWLRSSRTGGVLSSIWARITRQRVPFQGSVYRSIALSPRTRFVDLLTLRHRVEFLLRSLLKILAQILRVGIGSMMHGQLTLRNLDTLTWLLNIYFGSRLLLYYIASNFQSFAFFLLFLLSFILSWTTELLYPISLSRNCAATLLSAVTPFLGLLYRYS